MRLPKIIITEIHFYEYEIKRGKKHYKLYMFDRLVGVMPTKMDESSQTSMLNLVLNIRRAIKQYEGLETAQRRQITKKN